MAQQGQARFGEIRSGDVRFGRLGDGGAWSGGAEQARKSGACTGKGRRGLARQPRPEHPEGSHL